MVKNKEPIVLPSLIFSLYLILFPIDSALGELIGTISINNYIAIACLAVTLVFAIRRIIFKFDNFTIIYLVYVLYQVFSIIKGGYFFTNRNIIFLFYNFMTIIFIHVQWTEREKNNFKNMIILSMIVACYIIFTNINFNSSGRLYLSLGRNIDQNYLSANLIFGTAIITNSMIRAKKTIQRLIFAALLIWILVCIFYLGSRGSLFGNLVTAGLTIWLNRKSFNVLTTLIVVFSILIAVAAALIMLPDWIRERFSFSYMISDGGSGRLNLWKDFLNYYSGESLGEIIFGNGRGFIYDAYMITRNCTHNIFLKSLVEGGLIGFVLHIILFVELVITVNKSKSKDMIAIIAGYIGCGMFLDLDDYRIFPLMIIIIMMYKDEDYNFGYLRSKNK